MWDVIGFLRSNKQCECQKRVSTNKGVGKVNLYKALPILFCVIRNAEERHSGAAG